MKKLGYFALLCTISIMLTTVSTASAAETVPLGNSNLSLKIDYINFTSKDAKDLDLDEGLYVGLEGYKNITDNLYFGGEIGTSTIKGEAYGFDTEVDFIPVEMNVKYVVPLSCCFSVGFGGGLSYNYFDVKADWFGYTIEEKGWNRGGQAFIDFNYSGEVFFTGINAKYHEIEEDMQNWRIGAQLGFKF